MAEVDREILEHRVHIRNALDAIREDISELKGPLGALESRYLSTSVQLARIDSRIARIERSFQQVNA